MSAPIRYDEQFVSKHKRKYKAGSPILFFHSFNAEGHVEYQGYLLSLNSDGTGKAQLFEWFMGEPSSKTVFTRAFLEQCVFYTTNEAMNAAYCKLKREGRAG